MGFLLFVWKETGTRGGTFVFLNHLQVTNTGGDVPLILANELMPHL